MRWASTFLSFASVMTGEGHKEKVKGRGPALTTQRLNTHQEAFTSKESVSFSPLFLQKTLSDTQDLLF